MKNKKILIALSLLGLVSACGGPTESSAVPEAQPAGATSTDIGDHVVHYSAQLTDQLPRKSALAYDIVRSKKIAMLSVSVLDKTTKTAAAATVTVKIVNLTGQLKSVTMREIKEQDAIYYIGELPVANRETLIFDISVMPDGSDESSDVRFKRQFFTD